MYALWFKVVQSPDRYPLLVFGHFWGALTLTYFSVIIQTVCLLTSNRPSVNNICDIFYEDVYRFDRKFGFPNKSDGLFGVIKGFVCAFETQKSGTLHFHGIIFVAGIPWTSKQYGNMFMKLQNVDIVIQVNMIVRSGSIKFGRAISKLS